MAEPITVPSLYPGEALDNISGFPTIYHFEPSKRKIDENDTSSPLVVCVPGSMHLARIFYGGHSGSNKTDFLAYHLSNQGFNVLSVSFPLETEPEVMPATSPGFRVPDWGRQAATTAKKIIDQKGLSTRSIILIAWSMAGRMIVPFNISAKEMGLDVKQLISFAASPGISNMRNPGPGIICSKAGYFSIPSRLGNFYQQIEAMADHNDNHVAIPKETFLREYVGGTPINLPGIRLKYDGQGAFVPDEVTHEEETRVFDIFHLPFATALYPNSALDASHSLTDQATWGFLLTYKLETMIGKQGLQSVQGTPKWQRLMDLVHSAPSRLCSSVQGNHFFFVGENSACGVADQVVKLVRDAEAFQNELFELIR